MNYIADFMCKELMLLTEVDGYSHWNDEAKLNDEEREKILQLAGFTILRFTDEEVLNSLSQVEEKIRSGLGNNRGRVPDLITTI